MWGDGKYILIFNNPCTVVAKAMYVTDAECASTAMGHDGDFVFF